jgi:hypothetical protein
MKCEKVLGLINNGNLHPCAWTWKEEVRDCQGRPIAPGDRVFQNIRLLMQAACLV